MAGDSVPSSMKPQIPGGCEFPQHCSNLNGFTIKTCLVLLQVEQGRWVLLKHSGAQQPHPSWFQRHSLLVSTPWDG